MAAPQPASAPAKQVIDATVPGTPTSPVKNISEESLQRLKDKWNAQAEERRVNVAREATAPTHPTRVLRFELQQYGRYWQACVVDGKKVIPLLGAASLLSSALDALEDAILQRANRA